MPFRAGPGRAPSYAIIGDSHAAALRPAIDDAMASRGPLVVVLAGCSPLLGAEMVPMNDPACGAFRRRFLVDLASSPSIRTVFLAGRWAPLVSGTVPETGGTPGTFLKDDATTALSPQETLHRPRTLARSHDPADAPDGQDGHRPRQHSGAWLRRALDTALARHNGVGRGAGQHDRPRPGGRCARRHDPGSGLEARGRDLYSPCRRSLRGGLRTASRPDCPSAATATYLLAPRDARNIVGPRLKNAGLQRVASARSADQ